MRLLATVALAALAAACSPQGEDRSSAASFPALAGADRCAAVTPAMVGATTASGKWVEEANGLPGFCEVTATLSPVGGSNIGVVYRLPASWNGKVLGFGGGGWQGNVALQTASEGLRKGYATLQTDGGHAPGNVWDTSWAANPEALRDFSYRAVHEMTVAGKKLVAAYYSQPHRRAYFQGCSTGGRMALMEAQRFPEDYDAISAGAPVYTLQTQTSAIFRNQAFARNNGGFSPADLQLAQNAAVAACDGQDGLEDGLINDPRQCRWDPATIQCTGAKTDSCLAPAQVAALRSVYEGAGDADGEWLMHPLSRGGEAGWSAFVGTDGSGRDMSYSALETLFPLGMGRQVDLAGFSAADARELRRTAFAEMYEAGDPNLRPFFARGGKLILWHGENDPGPSPVATTDYARAVLSRVPNANQSMRYFLYPGVGHCAGGPGADQIELLEALDGWVETGRAPDVLIGRKANSPLVRPHCAWPNVARYRGSGDANDPASWQCVPRASS
ncbi:MAG TPA: tannase/feruloyl esterase family alpha/beta hydrolase [Croceibacterium sp.]|nr:tannase/feruloyl esterase family alpha/beta hydrolase [Croceibacterium sp.]